MSAEPDYLASCSASVQAASYRLYTAQVALAEARLELDRAEAEHEESLVAWGRARDRRKPAESLRRGRVICQVCGRETLVREKDGKLRTHDARPGGYYCPGSDRPPGWSP
jgi:hypothetical protein